MSVPSPERRAVRGLIGTVTIALVIVVSLNFNRLPLVGNHDVIHVEFAEAGGLRGGDAVMVSGAQVGKVRDVGLEGDVVVADVVITDSDLRLGDQTEARIVTVTLLGRAAVELVPDGGGDLARGDTIPVARTDSPYNLTSALNQLTLEGEAIDKAQLAAALDEVSTTLDASSESIGPALRGVTSLSQAISSNDDELAELLGRANRVTGVLADRDTEIASLLTSGQSLLAELDARQEVVVSLLDSTKVLTYQLRSVMTENARVIGPALDELNELVKLLNRNRTALQDTITGLRGYATAFGDASSTGPWFDAYIQNLTSPSTLVPVLSGVTP
jgi:phospholipid/cholesterol/gamma-HCH transport system substrate-binding protein